MFTLRRALMRHNQNDTDPAVGHHSRRTMSLAKGCILYRARGWSWMTEPAVEILLRCEDLAQVQLATFRYIPAIDDFEANLSYRGHQFALWMDWGGDISLHAKPDVPEESFNE